MIPIVLNVCIMPLIYLKKELFRLTIDSHVFAPFMLKMLLRMQGLWKATTAAGVFLLRKLLGS